VTHGGRRVASAVPRVSLLAAALLIAACGGGSDSSSGADAVSFTSSDGSEVSLSSMAGEPVVVNMWATWCTPCVKEMPAFDEVASSTDGVRIIGVNVGDSADDAAKFAADLGVAYEQFTDPDGNLSTALEVSGLPATAFVDADGKVIEVHQGAYTVPELRTAIQTNFPDTTDTGATTP
jgi:thiol-disulfide isomerase/thioredoxin